MKDVRIDIDEEEIVSEYYEIDIPDELEEFTLEEVGMKHIEKLYDQDFN